MSRRRSVYSLPKLRLKHKTITAIGSLVAFILAVISAIALITKSAVLAFWSDFLTGILGWTVFISPIIFLLSGLVLTRARFKLAQTNVLLGLILIILSLLGLTATIDQQKGGSLGLILWVQLSSFVTPIGAITPL